jgi:hypothetical protein
MNLPFVSLDLPVLDISYKHSRKQGDFYVFFLHLSLATCLPSLHWIYSDPLAVLKLVYLPFYCWVVIILHMFWILNPYYISMICKQFHFLDNVLWGIFFLRGGGLTVLPRLIPNSWAPELLLPQPPEETGCHCALLTHNILNFDEIQSIFPLLACTLASYLRTQGRKYFHLCF